MKKTIITMFALAGLAMGADIANPEASDFTWIPGSSNGITTNMDVTAVTGIINAIPADKDLVGWFGGTGQGYAQESYDEVHITGTDSFTFCSRPALTGEYVMMGIALPEKASAITLDFKADKYVGYAMFAYDGETVTEIMPKAVTNADKSSGATISVTQEDLAVAPSTLYVLWSSKPDNATSVGGGTVITVSDIAVSYTPAPVVPEPATATLSLLALAGLASRRRRH